MRYKKSVSAVKNPEVAQIQGLLNKALANLRRYNNSIPFGWNPIDEDGIFGPKTEEAVKCFQKYCNITNNGEVDVVTYNRLKNIASEIYSAPYKEVSSNTKSTHIEKNDFSIKEIADNIVDFINNFDDLIKDEIEYAKSVGRFDSKIVSSRFNYHISKLDPKMKKLVQLSETKIANDQKIKSLKQEIKSLRGDSIQKRHYQRQMSKPQEMNRYALKTVPKGSNNFIVDIKKWDIVQKIVDKLKQMGITGEIKVTKLKSIKVSSGGVFLAYSLKDIIWDLLQYDEWGTKQWLDDLKKDCYDFLDGLIIGIVSMVIAQVILLIVGAFVSITISGGWIAAIVVMLAMIIGILISLFISKVCGEDASISKYIIEDLVPGVIYK